MQSAFWQFFPVAVQVDGVWHLATFFYESCWDLAGFIVLWRHRLRARRAGDVFFLYLLWYGAGRTIIEGLRTDSLMLGPIRVSQLLSLALCLCGLAHFWRENVAFFKKESNVPLVPSTQNPAGVSAQPGKSAPPYRPWRICWYFCLAVCNSGCGAGLV